MKYFLLIISLFGALNAAAQTSDEAEILRLCLELAGRESRESTYDVQLADSLAPFVQEIKSMDIKLVPAPTDESILIEMVRQHPDTFEVKMKQFEMNSNCNVVRRTDGWHIWSSRRELIPRTFEKANK